MLFKERKRNRLKNFDYSGSGYYFVTICTKNREEYFGNVINGKMVLNEYGKIVKEYWLDLPNHYTNCELDEFLVMPNHVHCVIVIRNVGAIFKSPQIMNKHNKTGEINFAPTKKPTLSQIIKWFKSASTIKIRKHHRLFQWQRSFYDHIIRNEYELNIIRLYIKINPSKWHEDRNNSENLFM